MPTANHLALQFLPVNETDVDEHLGLKKPGGACLVAADMMRYIERSVLKTWLNSVTQISVLEVCFPGSRCSDWESQCRLDMTRCLGS